LARLVLPGALTAMFSILLFAFGVAILALGADSLTRGLVALGRRAGIGALSVGVLFAAFAGSAPDLALNIDAVTHQHSTLALGNIIGSSIVNIGLGLGIAALIRPLDVRLSLLRPLTVALMASGLVLLAMAHNGTYGYLDGALLIGAFVALVVVALKYARRDAGSTATGALAQLGETRLHLGLNVLRLIIGLGLIWYGARLSVGEAVFLAQAWGISELFAGLTLVAIGSSIPQLVLIAIAAWRGYGEIALLSVVGSNLFNLTALLGVTALIAPYPVPASLVWLELPALIAFSALLYPLLRGDMRITRAEGGVLLGAFVVLLAFQIVKVASG